MMNRLRVHCRCCCFIINRNLFLQTRLLHSKPTHYDTLGVKKTASQSEIKNAFIKLSKKMHPDLNPNDPKATSNFAKLNEAYTVLNKPSRRREYDLKISQKTNHMNRRSARPQPKVYRRTGFNDDDFIHRAPPRAGEYDEKWYDYNHKGPYGAFDRGGPRMHEEDKFNDTHKMFAITSIFAALIIGYLILMTSSFRRGIRNKEEGQRYYKEELEKQNMYLQKTNQEGIWPSSDYRNR